MVQNGGRFVLWACKYRYCLLPLYFDWFVYFMPYMSRKTAPNDLTGEKLQLRTRGTFFDYEQPRASSTGVLQGLSTEGPERSTRALSTCSTQVCPPSDFRV